MEINWVIKINHKKINKTWYFCFYSWELLFFYNSLEANIFSRIKAKIFPSDMLTNNESFIYSPTTSCIEESMLESDKMQALLLFQDRKPHTTECHELEFLWRWSLGISFFKVFLFYLFIHDSWCSIKGSKSSLFKTRKKETNLICHFSSFWSYLISAAFWMKIKVQNSFVWHRGWQIIRMEWVSDCELMITRTAHTFHFHQQLGKIKLWLYKCWDRKLTEFNDCPFTAAYISLEVANSWNKVERSEILLKM